MAKQNKTIVIAAAFCAVSLLVMLGVIMAVKSEPISFSPPEFDPAAVRGTPEVPENMGYMPVEVDGWYKVFICGALTADGGDVDVFFTLPEENNVWMKVKLLDSKGNVLGETGVIRPGEYIQTLKLEKVPEESVAVKLKIVAYQPDTWYSMGTVGLNTNLIIN